MDKKSVVEAQRQYYKNLFGKYNYSPRALASGEQIYKDLRYSRLAKVFGDDRSFTIHDVGCGLGHFYEFFKKTFLDGKIEYSGSEIVPEFVSSCREQYPECKFYERDISSINARDKYDYVVFGGTFYHLAGIPGRQMKQFVLRMLEKGFSMCRRGLATNFITTYCDFFDNELYYHSPLSVIDFTIKNLSRFFSIYHDTPVYEYTLCVFKEKYIKKKFSQKEFAKYFKKRDS